jgi:hypothetical protein
LKIANNGYDAIILLKKIFGEDRKYLILVDEISKANEDKLTMKDLDEILDKIEEN